MEDESRPARKPGTLLKRALFNQYNYILVGASGFLALMSGSWLPAVVGAGAEVLWLVLGADSSAFRRWVERQESKEAQERLAREATLLLASLEPAYVRRFQDLQRLSEEVQSLARENKGLEINLIADEMAKLGQVLHSFLKMAVSHQRLTRYLGNNPVSEVERDIARCQRALKQEEDPRVQSSLRQALSLAQKRLRQHQEIEGAWKALSVQMDTLEKSFDYLKSHVLGIGTHEELAQELDNLVTGVASVAELEASTADLLQDLHGPAPARLAAKRGGVGAKS